MSSCYHEQRCPPTRGSRRSNTRARQPSTLEHRRQHAQHSCLCGEDDGYDQLGTEALLGMSGSWTWCPLPFLYRDQTCCDVALEFNFTHENWGRLAKLLANCKIYRLFICKQDRKAPIKTLLIDIAFQRTFVFARIQTSINLEGCHSIVIRYETDQSEIANFDPYVNRSFSHFSINTR